MIPGIMASQSLGASGEDGVALEAGDLLAHIDFIDQEYTVAGDSHVITDIFGGPDFVSTTTVLGLRADYSNNNDAQATGALLTALQTYLAGGLTFVFQVERISTTAAPFGPLVQMFDNSDPDESVNLVFMEAGGHVNGAKCGDNLDALANEAFPLSFGVRNRIALTISGDLGDGNYRYAACANGGTVITSDVDYPLDYFTLARASFFGVNEWVFSFDGENYIRGLDIYGAVTDTSELQGLIPTFGGDTDAGIGTTATFEDVVLLVDFDGTDASTVATDDSNSANPIAFNGTAQIDTAQSKFGGASLLLDGSGYITVDPTTAADFQFGTGAFCVEAWVRLSAVPSGLGIILGQTTMAGSSESWALAAMVGGYIQLRWSTNGTSMATRSVAASLTTGVWYHIAWERDETRRMRLYLDGAVLHSEVLHAAFFASTGDVSIGASAAGDNILEGWIDEPRITKGKSQYSSEAGFSPPSEAFPRSSLDEGEAVASASGTGAASAVSTAAGEAVASASGTGAAAAVGETAADLWTPDELGSDVLVWYDALSSGSFSLSGSTVTQWNDLSANAWHLTSASTQQPTRETVADFGSENAVKFDGSNDYLKTGTWTEAQPITVCAIYRTGSTIDDLEQLLDGTNSGGFRLTMSVKWSGASNQPHCYASSAVSRHGATLSTSTTYIDICEANGASSKTWMDGDAPSPSTFSPGTSGIIDGICVGGSSYGSGLATFTGHIATFIIVGRALSGTEREKMEGYLAHRWSRTANLDVSHPYKTDPPEA